MAEDYSDLMGTGMGAKKETKPEDQFFHSIYIPAVERDENYMGVVETPGKLQIYGVDHNLNEVNMIILHVKQVLVKREESGGSWKQTCFSFQEGKLSKGTSGNVCPRNREEREKVPFCSGCRAEIIITGVYCEANGNVIKVKDKPVFVFLRGHGTKCKSIYDYLEEIRTLEIDPVMFPNDIKMETSLVKNKRFVTTVTPAKIKSPNGKSMVNIFKLKMSTKVDEKVIPALLEMQRRSLPQFKEKFDYSQTLQENNSSEVSGYTSQPPKQDPPKTQSPSKDSVPFDLDSMMTEF